ncbi:uncharacterized protein MYCFIDRAFT_208278 [Pseudocercospora fijiensis CIRAD86]|uniref:Methyltransferase domain-containing protein n=1 Tax=Pseudocercospora fijiensis (strain CIRAD86) TaxID=383855 RepID=M3A974_PSEFD|nr:uncharacterized protein MYCFIDRAFT_208278 [Pseudocercospora fijiensis CIRAD86]EME81176.1 hypothetical protein MYCFIDRAFT_208278 [Pseudocercospora fijiensis CIRAD86]
MQSIRELTPVSIIHVSSSSLRHSLFRTRRIHCSFHPRTIAHASRASQSSLAPSPQYHDHLHPYQSNLHLRACIQSETHSPRPHNPPIPTPRTLSTYSKQNLMRSSIPLVSISRPPDNNIALIAILGENKFTAISRTLEACNFSKILLIWDAGFFATVIEEKALEISDIFFVLIDVGFGRATEMVYGVSRLASLIWPLSSRLREWDFVIPRAVEWVTCIPREHCRIQGEVEVEMEAEVKNDASRESRSVNTITDKFLREKEKAMIASHDSIPAVQGPFMALLPSTFFYSSAPAAHSTLERTKKNDRANPPRIRSRLQARAHQTSRIGGQWRTVQPTYLLPKIQEISSKKPDIKRLDCGAGPGLLSASLAKLIPQGTVPKIFASSEGISNMKFQAANGARTSSPPPPGRTISGSQKKMPRSRFHRFDNLRSPKSDLIEEYLKLSKAVAKSSGRLEGLGVRLVSLAMEAGVPRAHIQASMSSWCYSTPEERDMWGGSTRDRLRSGGIRETVLERKLGWTEKDMDDMADAWQEWIKAEDGVWGLMNGEVIITKP